MGHMITLPTVVSLRMMLTAPATAKLNSDFSSLSLKYSKKLISKFEKTFLQVFTEDTNISLWL